MEKIKLRVGKLLFPVKQCIYQDKYFFSFDFNRPLMDEIKALEGAKWEGAIKNPDHPDYRAPTTPDYVIKDMGTPQCWSVALSQHNAFQLEYLQGRDPYAWYDRPLSELVFDTRPNGKTPMSHQNKIANFFLTYRRCLAAADTGVGKTLAAILAAEVVKPNKIWWVSSASGIRATRLELEEWDAKFHPRLWTYDKLMAAVRDGKIGPDDVPQVLILDEAHKVKTPTAQRSQATATVADCMRDKFGKDAYIWMMTGSPAPKNPADWWFLCRIACPGFLREGTYEKFKARLAIIQTRENQVTGGMFPQLVSWLDDEDKCAKCGQHKDTHDTAAVSGGPAFDKHSFVPSKNEVAKLYRRMKGLVLPVFKKDCLDLPDKVYRVIHLPPTEEMKNLARLIEGQSTRIIEKLTRWRELSDGFQYKIVDGPLAPCTACKGTGKVMDYVINEATEEFEEAEVECWECGGCGETPKQIRDVTRFHTPKIDALKDLLEDHESCGRLVTYAGFTAAVDLCAEVSRAEQWATIKADGRSWVCTDFDGTPIKADPLILFQKMLDEYPRVNFVGHPESAGEGITLTKSPSIVYYSNDFNFKSRIQSEDRIHRIGMDVNRGATIYDLCCLQTDYMVLENLRAKKRLQHITLTGKEFE